MPNNSLQPTKKRRFWAAEFERWRPAARRKDSLAKAKEDGEREYGIVMELAVDADGPRERVTGETRSCGRSVPNLRKEGQ
jgi:hypothetical protein